MTSPCPDAAGPVAGADWHAGADLLASYAAGTSDEVAAWSVEAHITACARCRSALSAQVDAQRLARNRSMLLVRAALGDGGRARRLLGRCGVPDHLLRLVAATPSLRRSWLLSVMGVLAVVTGEAAAVRFGWIPGGAVPPGQAIDADGGGANVQGHLIRPSSKRSRRRNSAKAQVHSTAAHAAWAGEATWASGTWVIVSSSTGSTHNALAVTAAARGPTTVAAASANAHNASDGSSSATGSHPGPGTANAAPTTGTSAAASAETVRASSKVKPEKGAATASR